METTESPFSSFSGRMQQIEFAGFWMRFVAALIDGIILAIPSNIISAMMGVKLTGYSLTDLYFAMNTPSMIMYRLITIVLGWLYFSLMESSEKQATIGKLVLRLKVTDLNGNRIGFGQASGRHFAKIISVITLFIGYMMAGWTEKKQALHDIIANTLVIKANPYQVIQGNNAQEGY